MEFTDCPHLGAAHRSLSPPAIPPRCQAKLLLWVSCPPGLGALLPGSGKLCSFSFNKWRVSPISGVSTAMLVGSHSLLQGIFPTQESNPGLRHCRWILYHLRHQRSSVLQFSSVQSLFLHNFTNANQLQHPAVTLSERACKW